MAKQHQRTPASYTEQSVTYPEVEVAQPTLSDDKLFAACKEKFEELDKALVELIKFRERKGATQLTLSRLRTIITANNKRLLTK